MKQNKSAAKERFDSGLFELRRFLADFDDSALKQAIHFFRTATELSPENANYWVGLGFALDMRDEPDAALAAMRRANELDPADEEAEVFLLTLLAETGLEAEALAGIRELAARTSVDIDSLRRDLVAAEVPSDALSILKNGFIHPRNFVRSRLEDAIHQAEHSSTPQDRRDRAELEDCHDRQAELEREIEINRIPSPLHGLVSWVIRLGIGDDPCRTMLIEELTQDEKDSALQDIWDQAAAVNEWLDSFGECPLSSEAAAFMYTLLAAEEMDG